MKNRFYLYAVLILTLLFSSSAFALEVSGVGLKPSFSVHKNAVNQSITSAVLTKVTWSTELFDTNANFDSTTNNRFTPTIAGKYLISATLNFTAAGNGGYEALLYKNGVVLHIGRTNEAGGSNDINATVTAVVDANGSTDYFEIYTYHNGGAGISVYGVAKYTFFTGSKID